MRSYLGITTPVLAALTVILGSMTACSHLEQSHEQSMSNTSETAANMDLEAQQLQAFFQRVRPGDTLETVVERLGPPMLDHAAPDDHRVWQYERVQIIDGAAVVTFNGFITLDANEVVTQVQQTKP